MRLIMALFGCAWLVGAAIQPSDECVRLRMQAKRDAAQQCYEKLARSSDFAIRAEGLWGVGKFEDAGNAFKSAVAARPSDPHLKVRWGRLLLERFNLESATDLFKEALDVRPEYGPAYLGLALVGAENYSKTAVESAETAIKFDPKLTEAQELLARLALEDSNEEKAADEAKKALAMTPDALVALGVLGSIDLLDNKGTSPWLDKALSLAPGSGRAHATAGHFFVLNRRYEEGIALYRKALDVEPELHAVRSQLGINLMRLGLDTDARQQLEQAYDAGQKDAATVNSLRLIDSYSKFRTFKTDRTVVKLHQKEAETLRPYVEQELHRALETFEKKYKLKLDKAVQVEVYPDHEDFAVRTMGMPGLGALGVTFGHVVAMDSPSGRPPGTFHWASTLWHELSHVFVLTATKHRVPRWFTEGMAVHEETAASPDWGDRLDPQVIRAIKEKKLLPVSQLDRGFIRPSYPAQVVVSYYQAGRICDYINEKWGYDKLLAMMHAFAESRPTPEVIQSVLGVKPEEFDAQFLGWLGKQVNPTVESYETWQKHMKSLAALAKSGKHDEAIKEGKAAVSLYPEHVEGASAYEVVSDMFLARGDKENARKQLEEYSKAGGRKPETLMKLARWQEEAADRTAAIQTLERLVYIYPMTEELHTRLGELYLSEKNAAGAIREFTSLAGSKTVDPAGTRYNLARAFVLARRAEEAQEQLLLALEAAPGFKPAQRLLLELSQETK
ncbi:MAG TPA: tetratricopeptide repeat protein [Bryobacteraceae bacterium]|nr:tetratricopeptide repeat protein [Bryobacteraceae bacterium]